MKLNQSPFVPLKTRRVVVQERGFGRHTIEVGTIAKIILDDRYVVVPVIGFAWPGFPPGFHSLN